jgi:ABC-type multidrug transport system fused ATPase/permease subunit
LAHTHSDELVPDDEFDPDLDLDHGAPTTRSAVGARRSPESSTATMLGAVEPDVTGGEPGFLPEDGAEEALSISLGFKLILRFIRMHPAPFFISISGGVLWAVMLVATSIVLRWATDEIVTPAFDTGVTAAQVWTGVAAIVGVSILRGLSVVIRRWFGSLMEARMQRSFRRKVTDRLLVMPMSSYRARPTGQLMATADVDVTTACQMIMPLPFSVGVAALVVVSLGSLYAADPFFALVALLLFPALTWLSRDYTTRIHEPAARVQQRLGEVASIAHESFDGVMVVKTLAREDKESERFDAAATRLAEERIGLARMTAVFEPLVNMLPNLGMLLLVVVGAVRIDAGGATLGDLVGAVFLFGWLAFPMRVVGFLFQAMPRAVVSIARVDALVAEPTEPTYEGLLDEDVETVDNLGSSGLPLPNGPLPIEFRSVSFSFETQPILDSVSFDARPGEVLALVGPTGSGKSTLVNLLANLDQPTSGEILIGGVPETEVDPVELRSAVAVAFQESYLFAKSIQENVTLDRNVSDELVEDALQRSMAKTFVGDLPDGISTVVGERGVTLSGGQRQRVALARALAADPRVVVLDDATSAVDPVIESRILEELRRGDTTMVIVAHRLSTITLADRVVHLDGGRVRGIGTHAEMLADPDYVALVTAYEEEEAAELAAAAPMSDARVSGANGSPGTGSSSSGEGGAG